VESSSAPSYYDVLGVTPTADLAAIRRAFRQRSMTAHPDLGGDESTFRELRAAYDVLADPRRRADHDRFLARMADAEVRVSARERTPPTRHHTRFDEDARTKAQARAAEHRLQTAEATCAATAQARADAQARAAEEQARAERAQQQAAAEAQARAERARQQAEAEARARAEQARQQAVAEARAQAERAREQAAAEAKARAEQAHEHAAAEASARAGRDRRASDGAEARAAPRPTPTAASNPRPAPRVAPQSVAPKAATSPARNESTTAKIMAAEPSAGAWIAAGIVCLLLAAWGSQLNSAASKPVAAVPMRSGAVCADGTTTARTDALACSTHRGVFTWNIVEVAPSPTAKPPDGTAKLIGDNSGWLAWGGLMLIGAGVQAHRDRS
jgi:curved DNA-binding protein CbpA